MTAAEDAVAQRAARIEAVGFDLTAAELEAVTICNLCAATEQVEVARSDRYGYPTRFVVCARCGLGFLSPRMTASAYAAFYGDTYRPLVSAYHGRLIDERTVQDEQREYAEALGRFLTLAGGEPPRTILDIGGSTGIVAAVVGEALGASCTVLDPAPDELAVAAAAGMETIEGFAEDFDPQGRTWDLVLLCQTIDHLLDASGTLEAIRRVTAAEGGLAFVDVLDVGFMLERRGAIEGAIKVDHPYYLTRATARAMFDRAGLQVRAERMSHDGHLGFLLAPSAPRELDPDVLAGARDALLGSVWALRATAS